MYQPLPSMRQKGSQRKSDPSDQGRCPQASSPGSLRRGHENYHRRKVWNSIVRINSPTHQKILNAIRTHSQLILDLKTIQPASINEIALESGQSVSSTRNKLNQLVYLDLVKRIRFEQHTLFCLNGCYNLQVSSLLAELFD